MADNGTEALKQDDLAALEGLKKAYQQVRNELAQVIVGQEQLVDRLLVGLLAGILPALAASRLRVVDALRRI